MEIRLWLVHRRCNTDRESTLGHESTLGSGTNTAPHKVTISTMIVVPYQRAVEHQLITVLRELTIRRLSWEPYKRLPILNLI